MLSHSTRRLIARRSVAIGATRSLNVHEYISMEVMNAHHIATPACFVAETPEEAENIFTHKLNHRKCICSFRTLIHVTQFFSLKTQTHVKRNEINQSR